MKQLTDTTWQSDNGLITFIQGDCMDFMAGCKENEFQLNVSDPPYGIGFSDYERGSSGIKTKERYTKNGKKKWDAFIPSDALFEIIQKTAKEQIIFGGNYFKILAKVESPNLKTISEFKKYISESDQKWLFWYKQNPVPNFADGELAWLSENLESAQIDFRYYGNLEGKSSTTEKIHPTQKPIDLYRWIFINYAKPTDRILDCFGGSMSSAIAAHMEGLRMTIIELDPEYFHKAIQRFSNYEAQQTIKFD